MSPRSDSGVGTASWAEPGVYSHIRCPQPFRFKTVQARASSLSPTRRLHDQEGGEQVHVHTRHVCVPSGRRGDRFQMVADASSHRSKVRAYQTLRNRCPRAKQSTTLWFGIRKLVEPDAICIVGFPLQRFEGDVVGEVWRIERGREISHRLKHSEAFARDLERWSRPARRRPRSRAAASQAKERTAASQAKERRAASQAKEGTAASQAKERAAASQAMRRPRARAGHTQAKVPSPAVWVQARASSAGQLR